MGWKAIKEHYNIGHFISNYPEGICIGSPLVYDIIVIDPETGRIKKRYAGGTWSKSASNKDLTRYQAEFDTDPAKLLELIKQNDIFERSIPVYTYDNGDILEKFCEEIGYPNITHDGQMMYDNTFSTDKNKVIFWAKRNAASGIKNCAQNVKRIKSDLEKMEAYLKKEKSYLKKLKINYPKEVK